MNRSRLLLLLFMVLAAASLLLTRFGPGLAGADTVRVYLGIRPAQSARAVALDEQVQKHLGIIGADPELRARLLRPVAEVDLTRFWIDACEVSQEDFERFGAWREAAAPEGELPADLRSESTGHRIAGLLKSPAGGVNYFGAAAYCEAAGGRLPWAEELEAAAAGREGRLYPWGDAWSADAWPYQDPNRNAAQVCGTHPATDSPEGVHDLANNAMEWSRGGLSVDARFRKPAAHGAPAVRSGARPLYALSAAWLEIEPTIRSHHLGFRCVYERRPASRMPWGARTKTARIAGGRYRVGLPPDARLPQLSALLGEAGALASVKLAVQSEADAPREINMNRCEVSRREYQRFMRDVLVRLGLFANEREPRHTDYTPQNWEAQRAELDLPVSGVNWWAADAFARWAGGRLPTREEWQLSAAGPGGNAWPWGREYEAGAAVSAESDDPPGPRRCGAAERDRSAAGVHDLAGNLSEWTRSIATDRGGLAVWVQGGNWLLPGPRTTGSFFGRLTPLNYRSSAIGFRVVYD